MQVAERPRAIVTAPILPVQFHGNPLCLTDGFFHPLPSVLHRFRLRLFLPLFLRKLSIQFHPVTGGEDNTFGHIPALPAFLQKGSLFFLRECKPVPYLHRRFFIIDADYIHDLPCPYSFYLIPVLCPFLPPNRQPVPES